MKISVATLGDKISGPVQTGKDAISQAFNKAASLRPRRSVFSIEYIKKISRDPDSHIHQAPYVYKILKIYAQMSGVPKMFLLRADIIIKQNASYNLAFKFLKNYARMYNGLAPDGYIFDFVRLLGNDEERDVTRNLLTALRIPASNAEAQDAIQMQLFRLKSETYDSEDVQQFIRDGIDNALESRHRSFDTRHNNYDEQTAIRCMVKVRDTLEKNNIPVFLLSHTLLGVVRDDNHIRRNYDIDMGVFYDDVSEDDLVEILRAAGFKISFQSEWKITASFYSNMLLELFRVKRELGRFVVKNADSIHSWYFTPFDLTSIKFRNELFSVPENYEQNLQQNYGAWQNRPIFHDRSYDIQNTAYDRNLESLSFLTNYCCSALNAKSRFMANQPISLLRDHFGLDYTDYFPKPQGELKVPEKYKNQEPEKSIIIIDEFEEYTPALHRIITTASQYNYSTAALIDAPRPVNKKAGDEKRELVDELRCVDIIEDIMPKSEDRIAQIGRLNPVLLITRSTLSRSLKTKLKKKNPDLQFLTFDDTTAAITADNDGKFFARQLRKKPRIRHRKNVTNKHQRQADRKKLVDWDQIWQKKADEHNQDVFTLEEILRVNGYDVAYAETGVESIRAYTKGLINKLGLTTGSNLLEVGSGAGAISMPMMENGINVTGLDRNSDLIEIANKAMPTQEFFVADAIDFDLQRKNYDAALAQGVFQFFPSQDYGIKSIINMLAHVREGALVAVTDLLDEANREALMEERIRLLGEEEYQKKYVETGLVHQFYEREALHEELKNYCSELSLENQFLDNPTASYKFNLIARK